MTTVCTNLFIRTKSLLSFVFVATLSSGFAQTAERLTDINTATISSDPFHLKVYEDKILFFARVPGSSTSQLWKTDGTTAGTEKVISSSLTEYSQGSGDFATTLNGIHYYQNGNQLISTDGTEAGTSVVKDFSPGNVQMFETGGKIFITVYFAPQHLGGLWVSDGSAANTTKLKTFDDPPVFDNTVFNYIQNIRTHQGEIFFNIQTPLNPGCCGQDLWKSDGTVAGTVSLDAAAAFYYSFIFQNSLFFFRWDGLRKTTLSYGNETLIKTMPSYGYVTNFQAVESGSFMYFLLADITSNQNSLKEELWRTDGTDAGTIKLYTADTGSPISSLTDVNGTLYCASGYKVIKSDGSVAGTSVIKDFTIDAAAVPLYPENFVAVDNKLFFSAFTLTGGQELWTTNGTTTQMVASPESASARSLSPKNIIRFGNKVFFTGTGSTTGTELFSSDGSVVSLVKDLDTRAGGSSITKVTAGRTKLYFTATNSEAGTELWRTDGTADGESIVNDLTLKSSSNPMELTILRGDTLLYTSYNGSKRHLYSTVSSSPLLELNGLDYGTYLFPTRTDDAIYISKYDNVVGRELMKTNVSSTQRVTYLADGSNFNDSYYYPTKFNNAVYFYYGDFSHPENSGLYKIDGSPAGASRVKALTGMYKPVVSGAYMYFLGNEPATGMELWRTDGTTDGTILLKDINPGTGGIISNSALDSEENLDGAVALNGKLYFSAYMGSTAHLWSSDGTEAGTQKVAAVNASKLTVAGDKLFFASPDGIYVSDGTEAGTIKIAAEYYAYALHAYRDYLVYSSGGDLKLSDGSADGTQTLATFPVTYVSWTKHIGNTLYFSADDMIHGQELWKFTLPDAPVIAAFEQSTTDKMKFTITGSNFSTASAVYFGGTLATSFTVVSDTEIEATVANVNASGVVRVNTKGGSATKSGFSFSIVPVITSFQPAIGVTGSQIVLLGSNFTGVTEVLFGGANALSFVITSDIQIFAIAGADAASGDVSVVLNGQTGSLPGFTFYGQPVIESLSSSTVTRGAEVTILGKNFYQVSAITLGNINITDYTILGTDEILFTVPAAALTGVLKIVAASGTVTTNLVVEIPVGVEEGSNSSAIEFYPNPVRKILRIVDKDDIMRNAVIQVTDSRGVSVRDIQMQYVRGGWDVDMQTLPSGLYIFLLQQPGAGPRVFKVFKN